MKKILFIVTFPNPKLKNTPKGGFKRNISLIDILSRKNKVDVLMVNKQKFKVNDLVNQRTISIIYKNYFDLFIQAFKIVLNLKNIYDCVIIYNPKIKTFPLIFLFNILRVPTVIDYVDVQGTDVEHSKIFPKIISRLIEYLAIKLNKNYITSSQAIRKRVQVLHKKARIFMYYGHNDLRLTADVKLDENQINFFYLGAMYDFSGISLLLDSFLALQKKHDNIRLFLSGHGPLKDKVKKISGSNNISLVELDDEKLYPFMKTMDILCLPYLHNYRNELNFPSKIIDYLWAGKPILATKVGEIKEFINFNGGALLVEPQLDAFIEGMEKLIADDGLRKILTNNANAFYKDKLNSERISKDMDKFLRTI